MQTPALFLLILGHLVTDTTQGALPALLPLLKDLHQLSYAQSGALLMTMSLTSSVIQPIFGYLTDRWRLSWLVPAGVALSGLGFGLIGLMPGYAGMLLAATLCGLGVASFHPEAFKGVLNTAGKRKVVGVSWFMVGGNTGMALGPVVVVAYCAWLGLEGTALFAIPGVVVAAMFLLHWRRLARRGEARPEAAACAIPPQPVGKRLGPLSLLISAVVARSWIHGGLAAFVPFYYVTVLGGDQSQVGMLLTTFLLAGVVGTLGGAPIAEKIGPKRFFMVSLVLVTPVLVWLQIAQGSWFFAATALCGCLLLSTWSVVIVMGQQIMPDRAGMVSGLLVGLALGTGGIGATIFGMVADHWGVTMVLRLVTGLPLLAAGLAWFLPLDKKPNPDKHQAACPAEQDEN